MSDSDTTRRLDFLEKAQELASKTHTEEMKQGFRDSARLNALEDVLYEIAGRMGISRSDFSTHLAARRNRYLGQYLDMACGLSEPLSAELDDRSEDEIDTGDAIPPLFPDQ